MDIIYLREMSRVMRDVASLRTPTKRCAARERESKMCGAGRAAALQRHIGKNARSPHSLIESRRNLGPRPY